VRTTCLISDRKYMVAGLCVLFCSFAFVQAASAQSVVTVMNNGDPQNRVDIAIVGDGYTSSEMSKYAADVQQVIDGFFSAPPFDEYQHYFNVHRIDVVSNESGADHPERTPPVYKDTAFDSAYNCSGIQRLICANTSKVLSAASSVLAPAERDFIIVIVNDPTYGGSGGSVPVISTDPSVVELALHEEAHSFGLLADEYGGPPPPACDTSSEPSAANVTMQVQRGLVKWAAWVDSSTPIPTFTTTPGIPGLFQGAQYCDTQKYRPTYNSRMRSLNRPYEQVNAEQLIKRVYNLVSPMDTASPPGSDVIVPHGRTQTFSITTPRPLTHELSVTWLLDNQTVGSELEFTLDSRALALGAHKVEVRVEDPTSMVRNDPAKVLTEQHSWDIDVTEPSGTVIALNGGGAATASTAGENGGTLTGYAALSINSGPAPYGTAVFSFRQDGTIVSEAGVPASPPTSSARIFIDYRSQVNAVPARSSAGTVDANTGIAIVNPGSQPANVTFTLRDKNGNTLAIGNGRIKAESHVACFIDRLKNDVAPDFNLPADFQSRYQFGTLDVSADQPVSVLALRGTTNQRNEFLITTTPVADLTQTPGNGSTYFPQFADGGGYTTSLILLNTSNVKETGTLQIRDKDGLPLTVNNVEGTNGSSFPYSIEPGGLFRFQTDGFPADTKAGWVQLIPDTGTTTPVGSGVFGFNPNDVLVSESGIPAANATTHARVYVDLSGNHNTGLAIVNVSGISSNITINAYQKDGVTAAGTNKPPIPLPANGYTAGFVDGFVTGLPAGFTGVLDISSLAPFAALTLRSLDNERGDFLMTTFPVVDVNVVAPSPIVFPQVADGGGYVTEIILISGSQPASTTIRFYDENGVPTDFGK
jgi:hypothetical protein